MPAAIFYDVENLALASSRNRVPLTRIDMIAEAVTDSPIWIKQAFADWTENRYHTIRYAAMERGIETVQRYSVSGKNIADIEMTVAVMETLFTRPEIDTFVLVSGDVAFAAVARALKARGKTVVAISWSQFASRFVQRVCHRFVALDEYFMQLLDEVMMEAPGWVMTQLVSGKPVTVEDFGEWVKHTFADIDFVLNEAGMNMNELAKRVSAKLAPQVVLSGEGKQAHFSSVQGSAGGLKIIHCATIEKGEKTGFLTTNHRVYHFA